VRRFSVLSLLVLAAACGKAPAEQAPVQAPGREQAAPVLPQTRPEELGLLEDPDRDEWQQPERVMDALKIADGARVADIGAGGGWFTIKLARRVGPNGRVYAEDIRTEMLASIDKRVALEGLKNVTPVLGTATDSHLEPGLQAVLLVDIYTQLTHPVELLRNAAAALAPNGRLGVVEFKKDGGGGPGPALESRLDPNVIIDHAAQAGLKLEKHETFLKYQYLLVFVK
jgi:ubiquinone/menaquinone biosynthesis C-methylase UbiE